MWFRRDLRLADNPSWADATASHDQVLALFIIDHYLLSKASTVRRNQMLGHLYALDASLQEKGGRLVVTSGAPVPTLQAIAQRYHSSALYYNADVSPYAVARDRTVTKELSDTVRVQTYWGSLAHEPGRVLTTKGTLSKVFTPFYRAWETTSLDPWPGPGNSQPLDIAGEILPPPDRPLFNRAGEDAAFERLTAWAEQVDDYPQSCDRPGIDGTSQLSADLKFGTLSPRTVINVLGTTTEGRRAFIRQLAWRDWWAHTLYQNPKLPSRAVNDRYDSIEWNDSDEAFEQWCVGQTGYPIVDAGMRQLAATGWMHNRVRMICASFLVKDLLIDWRRGERFFRHHLVDADTAQNAGNWQWVAGTGPDAAPYFRIFNPTTQSKKFDPDGDYLRRWLPELHLLPARAIHCPSTAKPSILATAGVELGMHYPAPIVDHAQARAETLDAYKAAKLKTGNAQ